MQTVIILLVYRNVIVTRVNTFVPLSKLVGCKNSKGAEPKGNAPVI